MANRIEERLKAVDQKTLTPLVQRALDREDVEVDGWCYEPVIGGIEMSSGVYRFSGNGRAINETLPWTLILKVAQATPDSQGAPHRWRHWKREMLAYQSGLLDNLPGGLVPPRCYGAAEHGDGITSIWMEEVRDEVYERWPLEYYGSVARCLGQFNGAYLMGKPLPDDPWLTRQHLRQYVENAAPAVELLLNSMDHPLIQRALPGISAGFLQEIWEERHSVLETIEHLPQTLCHLDAFRRNLFSRRTADGGDQVVAVDWSYLGIAAVGEEIAPLSTPQRSLSSRGSCSRVTWKGCTMPVGEATRTWCGSAMRRHCTGATQSAGSSERWSPGCWMSGITRPSNRRWDTRWKKAPKKPPRNWLSSSMNTSRCID
jgi:hypothetical protein